MSEWISLVILIPALPLVGSIVTALVGRRLGERVGLPVIVALVGSSCASIALVVEMVRAMATESAGESSLGFERILTVGSWIAVDARPIGVALRADPLTAVMLTVVSLVSLLVAIYSTGYLRDDPGRPRYFAFIGLFAFSMTMLVSVSNFLLLYLFWEWVGLCSYLLIGYWYQKPSAAAAAKKAFLTTRLGDLGLLIGLFLIWMQFGTFDFHDTLVEGKVVAQGIFGLSRLSAAAPYAGTWMVTTICLLMTWAAMGKSAQFPLHVWLPDAMEGPSPVSALIHAATMVTAGVYLIARSAPLFAASGSAGLVVAVIGAISATGAALVALTQTDMKRVLAYSTISQLGYMFMAVGLASSTGVASGMFHLVTHAFFKALLFLAAGNVLVATGHVLDLRRFGGLRHRLPATCVMFGIGALGLAGLFPLAGFWSKEPILMALSARASQGGPEGAVWLVCYLLAFLMTFVTAFYIARVYFVTFFGPYRMPDESKATKPESCRAMTVPLGVLASATVLIGVALKPTGWFDRFLAQTPTLACLAPEEPFHAGLMVELVGTAVVLAGILLAAFLYLRPNRLLDVLSQMMRRLGLYQLSQGKFFVDELFYALVVGPLLRVAAWSGWFDDRVVDRSADEVGRAAGRLGGLLRLTQNGVVSFYALAMMVGLVALLMVIW